ncbi:hypothetical protein [Stenotrophomonas acidaminiphila]|jgi:hypothetical protein|uniref:hypothetical protein n=1 Tax=Stenotrophomonas acidaminiphila TaxID=128780 RepID=UPI0024AD6408|nr:hypothetical protein [Stenotrophomonas acidaminiphila]WHL19938.1 hypothetical protein QLF99_05860 [Stenotrophomonas acidaminiphila]
MPVSENLAIPLFRAFAVLEYQLKRRHAFLKADRFGNAMVDWSEVKAAVDGFPAADFVLQLDAFTRQKVLDGARERPKVQVVVNSGGRRKATFEPRPLQPPNEVRSDARALVEATKRVRNNLFHGGKEDPGEQPFDGDDDEWGRAALDVAQTLLDLMDQGAFGAPDHP